MTLSPRSPGLHQGTVQLFSFSNTVIASSPAFMPRPSARRPHSRPASSPRLRERAQEARVGCRDQRNRRNSIPTTSTPLRSMPRATCTSLTASPPCHVVEHGHHAPCHHFHRARRHEPCSIHPEQHLRNDAGRRHKLLPSHPLHPNQHRKLHRQPGRNRQLRVHRHGNYDANRSSDRNSNSRPALQATLTPADANAG